ncbi:MAG: hypothetical protein KC496_10750, partial [Anaerolineae bacterium]|nr:hypothetical protein [Anaerolineae bacterium]
ILWYAFVSLANLMLAQNKVEEAEASIAQAQAYVRGFHSPMMAGMIAAAEARLRLRIGQVDAAVEWAERYTQAEPASYQQDFENLTLARVRLVQGDTAQALSVLTTLIDEARTAGRSANVMRAEVLRALIFQADGDTDLALQALKEVLNRASQQGIIRLLLDEVQPVRDLLHEVVRQDIIADYAAHLLEIAAGMEHTQHPADVLTEREIEVLHHIAAGASNNDIAHALVLSVGTVKSHIHHIMNKLDAQNRTEAVSKARNINILPH